MKASPTYLVLIHFYDVISCYSFISWIYSLTTYLVGGIPTLWKIWKSVEIRIVIANPNMWKVKDVPNNQLYIYVYMYMYGKNQKNMITQAPIRTNDPSKKIRDLRPQVPPHCGNRGRQRSASRAASSCIRCWRNGIQQLLVAEGKFLWRMVNDAMLRTQMFNYVRSTSKTRKFF